MKLSLIVTDDAVQFNLTPETDAERDMLAPLRAYRGSVEIQTGADLALCQGGYVRNFGHGSPRSVAVVLRKQKSEDA